VVKPFLQKRMRELNYEGMGEIDAKEVGETVDVAIEALEKRVMKKPTFEADGYYNGELVYETWICPSCDERYEVENDDYKFCPNCGQAIDWSKYDIK